MNISDMKKYFLNFCGAVLIFLLTFLIFSFYSVFENIDYFLTNKAIAFTSRFIISTIAILLLTKIYNEGILNNLYKKLSIKKFLSYEKKYVLLTFSLLIISLLFSKISITIISKITQGYSVNIKHNFFYFIEAALIIPFIEELIFRGIFFNITFNLLDMEDKVIKKIAIITNIMLFGSIHYINHGFADFSTIFYLFIAVFPRLLISISLIYVYFKTRDIKYNIILHLMYNSIFVLLAFI